MMKSQFLCACAFSAIALVSASPALAQVQDADEGSEIVVTGSLIAGTPEDAALPVDVIGSDELARQGQPSPVELLKALPTSSGVLGDSNQFDNRSQGAEGIATANLRGLSPQRTLVLLNNKRLVTAGNGVPAVDLNLLPQAAIGRIEILKDGAAATYGSDAVAGVVNFITRTNQEGFVGSASYEFVRSTEGDVEASLSYGHSQDGFRVLLAAGYQKRSQLLARDRDWAIRPYAENPEGGWTGGGNPANFVVLGPVGTPVTGVLPDRSCLSLGGFIGAPKVAGTTPYSQGQCYNQYTTYDALSDLEERGQAFVDVEIDLAPGHTFEVTALYGRSTVPHYLTSPSYLLTQSPSPVTGAPAAFSGSGFFVPNSNPGLAAYRAANPLPAGIGVLFPTLLFRPFLLGGNPSTLDEDESGSARGKRKSESFRATAEFRGEVTDDLNYSVSATYHDYYRYIDGADAFGDRVQRALIGLGGPNCNTLTPGTNGCLYFNPFGNAYAVNPATGQTNSQPLGPTNSPELVDWFYVKSAQFVDTELFVAEGTLSGSTGITLPGGDIQFGVGAQYRHTSYTSTLGPNNNLETNPCRETPINGNLGPCAGGAPANGALGFLGTGRNADLSGSIYAVYGELQLPILDTLNLQLAARFEDYGGETGSTVDPQARLRFQATDWLAFRGGVGTTFRGPTLANVDPGRVTSLQIIGSSFKPVDVFGNPALKPESSTNYSAGIILSAGGFNATLDYYRYDLKDVIVSDPLGAMVSTLFPTGAPNNCTSLPAEFLARFTFAAACSTGVGSIARVSTRFQNGASITNEGLDFVASYRNDDMFGGELRFGAGVSATYVLQNRISDIFVEGVKVAGSYNGVGLLNYQTTLYPVPEWKGQAFLDLGSGPVDARLQINYIDGLHDQRADTNSGPYAPNPNLPGSPSLRQGADIDPFTTIDFNFQVDVGWDTTFSGTINNLLDKDPPFAREDYNYEPFVGNALGRTVKLGVTKKF